MACNSRRPPGFGLAGGRLLVAPGAALAHTGVGVLGGFASGFEHPVFGYDHLLAMVEVGVWGAQLGSPLIWTLPVTFPIVMAVSGMLAVVSGCRCPGSRSGSPPRSWCWA